MANLSFITIPLALLFISGGVSGGKQLWINTPELYQKFVDGEIGSGYKDVAIVPGAHWDIMSLPKLLANYTQYDEISLFDGDVNNAVLKIAESRVICIWTDDGDYTEGLPMHYTHYSIWLLETVSFSEIDYKNLFNWKQMTRLEVTDRTDFAYDLSKRAAEMKSLPLSHLKLQLKPISYEDLKIKPFLEHLTKLVSLKFETYGLYKSEVETFVKLQEVPSNFSVKFGEFSVEFVREN